MQQMTASVTREVPLQSLRDAGQGRRNRLIGLVAVTQAEWTTTSFYCRRRQLHETIAENLSVLAWNDRPTVCRVCRAFRRCSSH